MMNPGTTYLLFVPPAWFVGGTLVEVKDGYAVFKDCAYLESVGEGSMIGGIPAATTAKELNKVCKQAWGIPDGLAVRMDAILMCVPCARDLKPLSRQEDAAAIKGSK